jgi:hypothetical protein
MEKGRTKAYIAGYIYLEIAGKIIITRFRKEPDGRTRVLEFHDVEGNFIFEDQTSVGETGHFNAVILSSTVVRREEGTQTIFEINVI